MLRYRFQNRYLLISILLMAIIMFLSFILEGNIFDLLFLDPFPEFKPEEIPYVRARLLNGCLQWDYYFTYSNFYALLFYPILASLPIVRFYKEKAGFTKFIYGRIKHYPRFLLKTIFTYSCVSGLAIMLGYNIFMLIGVLLQLNPMEVDTGMFTMVFPNLSIDFTFLCGVLHSITIFFVFGFVFGLFTIAVSLKEDTSYKTLLIPTLYYLIVDTLCYLLCGVLNTSELYRLSPFYMLDIMGWYDIPWYNVYIPMIPVLVVSIFLITRHLMGGNKIGT